jgi:predicted ATPase/transcriptional regulator with XRE-family HTH domain
MLYDAVNSSANSALPMPFGRWLKKLRAQHDLTQEALAELAFCSVQTIRFFESGKRRPSLEMAEKLAEVLNLPADQRPIFIRQARIALNTADQSAAPAEDETSASNPASQPLPHFAPASTVVSPSAPAAPVARLPLPTTVLVGRQPEAMQLHQLLSDAACRLVTLVGPGGIGKTRLALHMAHMMESHFADGAYFVPLVSLSNALELPSALAGAMNATLAGDSSSRAQIDTLLSGKSLLLVLDNFEHLLALDGDAVTALVDHILQHIPGSHLLITSRERLRLNGEYIMELGGLAVPRTEQGNVGQGSTEQRNEVAASEAVMLFLQRARQCSPSFTLTPANRDAIVRLCNLLGGMPLGIELAAAWIRTLTVEEIADEISRSLDFLTLADRSAPIRHRSLRAAFEYSWKLLSLEEQQAVARLSIFRGGFRREAAQSVAGATLSHLAALIDKSLVQAATEVAEPDGALRYEIHELLRQYLRNKLIEIDNVDALMHRYAEYFTSLAEQTDAYHYADLSPARFKQLRSEQGNLRAVLEWSLTSKHAPHLGVRLVGALGRFWYMGDAWAEGREWLRMALAIADEATPPQVLAKALTALGEMEHSMAEYAAAQRCLEEALTIWRAHQDQANIAWTLFQMGILSSTIGDYSTSEAQLHESLVLYRQINEPWFVATVLMQLAGIIMIFDDLPRAIHLLDEALELLRDQKRTNSMGVALNLQGWIQMHTSDYPAAIQHFEEALAIGQSYANYQLMGWSLRNLGIVHLLMQKYAESGDYLRSCLRFYQQINFKSGMIIAFEVLAAVSAEVGEWETAVRWLGVAEELRRVTGQPRPLRETQLYYNRTHQLTTAALSQESWDATWRAGAALPLDEALTQATITPIIPTL